MLELSEQLVQSPKLGSVKRVLNEWSIVKSWICKLNEWHRMVPSQHRIMLNDAFSANSKIKCIQMKT